MGTGASRSRVKYDVSSIAVEVQETSLLSSQERVCLWESWNSITDDGKIHFENSVFTQLLLQLDQFRLSFKIESAEAESIKVEMKSSRAVQEHIKAFGRIIEQMILNMAAGGKRDKYAMEMCARIGERHARNSNVKWNDKDFKILTTVVSQSIMDQLKFTKKSFSKVTVTKVYGKLMYLITKEMHKAYCIEMKKLETNL